MTEQTDDEVQRPMRRSKMIVVKLSYWEWLDVWRHANEEGMTLSAWVRRALDRAGRSHGERGVP